jgi:alanine dehydrogenase
VRALRENRELLAGANVVHGRIVYPGVAEAFGLPLSDLQEVLGQHSML